MVAIIIDGQIKTYNSIPKTFGNKLNYDLSNSQRHYNDGFRDVVYPQFDPLTDSLGTIFFDESKDVFTYEIVSKPQEEIRQSLIAISEIEKQDLIQQKLNQNVINEAQLSDDSNALDNQALFPFWEYPYAYELDFKCQDFTAENELVLYKCVQSHTSQSDWRPKDVPALFTRVAYPNEILEWVQPTGAQDAYSIDTQVIHNGFYWTSIVPDNVWEPSDSVPTLWLKGDAV